MGRWLGEGARFKRISPVVHRISPKCRHAGLCTDPSPSENDQMLGSLQIRERSSAWKIGSVTELEPGIFAGAD